MTEHSAPGSSEIRLIKKYPNRRLYDTAVSSYITLEDVKRLVLTHVPFQVLDAKTQEDLTHNTLLQIITEQEDSGAHVLSTDLLQNIIRSYGHSMQGFMTQMLDESLRFFNQQQSALSPLAPMSWLTTLTEQNMKLWKQWQEPLAAKTNPSSGDPATE